MDRHAVYFYWTIHAHDIVLSIMVIANLRRNRRESWSVYNHEVVYLITPNKPWECIAFERDGSLRRVTMGAWCSGKTQRDITVPLFIVDRQPHAH